MTPDEQIEAYKRERDSAVLASLEEFEIFAAKYGAHYSTREAALISQHKLRTAILSLPNEVRKASREWLLSRGYQSWDDNDLI